MNVRFEAPRLQTDRLSLRAPNASDFEARAAFLAAPQSQFVGGPMTREEAWRSLSGEIGHWILRGFGRWSLVARETGETLGIVGLWYPEGWPEPELGWSLFLGATGNGYATEAAFEARRYAYEDLGWTTAISLIAPENHASKAVARRLGATYERDFTHERYGAAEIWRHPGPEAH